jgi:hypothetical protein
VARDITDKIEKYCEEMFGHTNWAIISTLSDQEKVGLDKVADIETIEGVDVAFYFDETLEKSIEVIDDLMSGMYEQDGQEEYAQRLLKAWNNIKTTLKEEAEVRKNEWRL